VTSRVHLYPPRDDDRQIRACYITSGIDFNESPDAYTMKLGVSDQYGVDYHATYDGSKAKISANVPYALYDSVPISVRSGQSVCVDVTSSGLPTSLAGTSIHLVMGDTASDPAQRVRDQNILAAVDGVTDWVLAIHGDEDVVTVVLPDLPLANRINQTDHEYSAVAVNLASASFIDGAVSVDVNGSPNRPVLVHVTAQVSFNGSGDPTDALELAIGDGSTDLPIHSGSVEAAAERDNVSCSRAESINTNKTFKVRYRAKTGNPQVITESISVIAVEA